MYIEGTTPESRGGVGDGVVEVDREGDHVDEEAGQGADQVEDGGEGTPGQSGQELKSKKQGWR